ncbi:serine hydrolase domain-containing protein [Acetobacter oeni]
MARRTFLRQSSCAGMVISAASLTACAKESRSADFDAPDRLLRDAVERGSIPGVVAAIGHNGVIVHRVVMGRRALVPVPEAETWDTRFDMASLTKVTVTAPAVMQLWEQGLFQLDDPVARYLPEFGQNEKQGVTIRHLLTHFSGLPPDVDLTDAWTGKDEAVSRAMRARLTAPVGTKFIYSDINFITLGLLVEKLSGLSLNVYANQHILAPLGMTQSGFLPDASLRPLIAPTQYDEDRIPLRGVVHDPTARRMGGVAGHAGLFSCAQDMSLYARNLLDRRAGRPSTYPLKSETVLMMTTPQQPGTQDLRGLGWDIGSHYATPRGDIFPVGSFGHTGYTGTSLWMDPTSDSFVLILTNRVHPADTHGKEIVRLRHDVATAAARALGLTA